MGYPYFSEELQYRVYLVERLRQALARLEGARTARERAAHLRACRYYCELLQGPPH